MKISGKKEHPLSIWRYFSANSACFPLPIRLGRARRAISRNAAPLAYCLIFQQIWPPIMTFLAPTNLWWTRRRGSFQKGTCVAPHISSSPSPNSRTSRGDHRPPQTIARQKTGGIAWMASDQLNRFRPNPILFIWGASFFPLKWFRIGVHSGAFPPNSIHWRFCLIYQSSRTQA